jgi:hypothetical protein
MRMLIAVLVVLGFTCAVQAQAPAINATALGQTTVDRLIKHDFAAVVAMFDDTVRAALPEEKLRASWLAAETQFGPVRRTGAPRTATKGDLQIVIILAEFERNGLDIQMVFNASGKIAGIAFRPPATSTTPFVDAPYVIAANYTEREVTVDVGGWPLPGSLSMPVGGGPFPAIVLVHGSGPNDRDQTFGPNKPFRDLAHGLASRGIAVLRYEKRTRQHGPKVAPLTQFTVKEETIDDAVGAVRLLRATPRVDPKRVFVLGHSLGGMLAPRIAAAGGADIAGLIIMAGAVRSLEQSLVDQSRYLAQADGKVTAEEEKQLAQFEQLAAAVKTLKPGDPPPQVPGASAPTSYWIDLRGYDPPTAAQAVKMPMLILQGGRDYQVTAADFEKWKAALGTRRDVTLKLYPALNHMFVPGTGPSVPAEYLTAGHVDEAVVRDIAEWVARTAK